MIPVAGLSEGNESLSFLFIKDNNALRMPIPAANVPMWDWSPSHEPGHKESQACVAYVYITSGQESPWWYYAEVCIH